MYKKCRWHTDSIVDSYKTGVKWFHLVVCNLL